MVSRWTTALRDDNIQNSYSFMAFDENSNRCVTDTGGHPQLQRHFNNGRCGIRNAEEGRTDLHVRLTKLKCACPPLTTMQGQRSIRNRRAIPPERERHNGLFRIRFPSWPKESSATRGWRFGSGLLHSGYRFWWGEKTAGGTVQAVNKLYTS